MKIASFDPEKLTAAQFRDALVQLGPRVTETHHRLLRTHYHFPKHSASSRQLSAAMGWKGASANAHYGGLAGSLCEILGRVEGSDAMYTLARFIPVERTSQATETLWAMRPNLAKALSALKWV